MKTLVGVIASMWFGAATITAVYELHWLPQERVEFYKTEARADSAETRLEMSINFLSTCIERLEEYSAVLDSCERRLITCTRARQ